jgi:energy-coupling factor transporter ATP-binding protein EcfA2
MHSKVAFIFNQIDGGMPGGELLMDQLGRRLLIEGVITEKQLDQALERQKRHGGRLGQNLVALNLLDEGTLERFFKMHPVVPKTVEETGLSISFIGDLVMKHLLTLGEFKLADVSEAVGLPISVIDSVIEGLRKDKYVEVKGGTGFATVTYTFKVTETGIRRGNELMELCRYAGPAPVTLEMYNKMVELQTIKSIVVSEDTVKKAFSHLIISDKLLKRLGPAISSGKALFFYGPPGNGKTAIAETIGKIMPDTIYIPHAITVGGQIISLFDPVNHTPVENGGNMEDIDRRWLRIRRPVVMTGGELSLRMLDLDFNPISKYYEASLQMKANNGVFIADDFGRQQIEPHRFLNRWIVPLDRRMDFMTLHTGMMFVIPFDMLVVFATNLEPKELVDEAFLRRIRYKIKIEQPSPEEFEAIFRLVCKRNQIPFNVETFEYLLENYYKKCNVNFNACHPRDIIDHVIDNARYYNHAPQMTREGIDMAWQNYFVD